MAYEYNIYTIHTICTHVWVHNIFLPKDAVISVTYLDKILLKAGDDFFFDGFFLLYSFGGIIVSKSENHQSVSYSN